MSSCLSSDLILQRVISKLNLREMFSAQGVCQRWKNIAIQCLQHHEYLIISEDSPSDFWCYDSCEDHPFRKTANKDNLIWGKYSDPEFWQRTLSLLQGVMYVQMDVRTDDETATLFAKYKSILQLVIDYCGQSLECLCIPHYYDEDDETFPLTDLLPRLKHMVLTRTTSQVTKNILTACPSLEYLRSDTSFTEWLQASMIIHTMSETFRKRLKLTVYFLFINFKTG